MAASHLMLPCVTASLVLLFVPRFLPIVQPQTIGNSQTGPTVSECVPRLLSLAPCEAFVQGTSASPPQTCCYNLRQVYNQELSCLCLMVNDSSISAFPINRTLALQLPVLCNLQGGLSACSAGDIAVPFPPSSPTSQVSFGTKTNATVAASPMITVSPTTGILGSIPHSVANLNAINHLVVALIAEMLLLGMTYTLEAWNIMFLTF
ncbi:protein YLS3 [Coffea eugenioides]|nr:protein YLS3 [Coffea eugenioides]